MLIEGKLLSKSTYILVWFPLKIKGDFQIAAIKSYHRSIIRDE